MNYSYVIKNFEPAVAHECSQQCADHPQFIPVESISRLVPASTATTSHRPTVPCHVCGKQCDLESISIVKNRNLCGYHALTAKIKGWFEG